ncbi:MAG: Mur ligase domain-containing protein [Verrucomicrobiae bacterium]|nr:Mur ligase domain-containing protein [Verrucomicrobiae bacterium]
MKVLGDILDGIPRRILAGGLDVRVTGLEYDVRRVRPGTVYFALSGGDQNGHDRILAAIERGAVAVVCERSVFRPLRVTTIQVSDSRAALLMAGKRFYDFPDRRLTVIGVTGGEARGRAAVLVRRVLQHAGIETGVVGGIVDEYGDRAIPKFGLVPESLDVQRLMLGMAGEGCEVCVFEIPPFAGVGRLYGAMGCDVVVIGHGALERRFGEWAYREQNSCGIDRSWAKGREELFELVVYDVDDCTAVAVGRGLRARKAVTYGGCGGAAVQLQECTWHSSGTRVKVKLPGGCVSAELPLFDRDDLRGLLGALGVAVGLGVPLSLLRLSLRSLGPVPGHLEMINCGQPFRVVVDGARTVGSLTRVISVLRQSGSGRVLLVFGAGADQGLKERTELGRVAGLLADYVVVTSDNPCHEEPCSIAAEVVGGIRLVRTSGWLVECDRRAAIARALEMARRGDTVLIAGKGHITYQKLSGTVVPFDDRVHARESLEHLGYCCAEGCVNL